MATILDYFERTAASHAQDIAVDDGELALTYSDFAALCKRSASAYVPVIGGGEPVAVFAEKGTKTLAAMIGAVYAGGFYVSINPEQPAARVSRILNILEAKLVVVDKEREETLAMTGFAGKVIALESRGDTEIDEEALAQRRAQLSENDPLYSVFTSGSTGDPKGILVSHKSVIDFISHFTEIFAITDRDIIGNQAPFDFDVSVKDIYSAFTTGARLILIPRTFFSTPPRLLDYLIDKDVTVLVWAVSALCIISGLKGLSYKVPDKIRIIMFSGEVMPVKHLQMWQKALPGTEFVNLYGPSEITCNCTYHRIDHVYEKTETLPIGKPFPGRTVFLVDEKDQRITAPGERGEICCAGESIAIGYINNPEQTAKHFTMYDLDGREQRIYRTGDMAKFAEDGNLYFAGRGDFQIKHMGHRIELEEIETAFSALDGVDRACCFFDQKKNRIVSFYTGTVDGKEVRTKLKVSLPNYMVPNRITKVDEMPLNKNGKIDRAYFRSQIEGK